MGLQAKLPWLLLSYLFSLIVVPTVNGQPNRPPTNPQGRPTPNQGKQNSPEFKDLAFERLSLKPLDDGKVSAHFEFDFVHKDGVPRDPRTLGMKEADQHYEFLPLSLGQILREYAVAEVHLTMNNGRWNYPLWGYPENAAVASGVELWAWMADGGVRSIDERWSGLSNALAGLFCASLSALPDSRTTIPIHSFRPDGKLPAYVKKSSNEPPNDIVDQNYILRHAVLPSESICTENLTPFIKLLPCKTHAGLAELLNPHKIFSGWWYGVGIHATWHDGIAADANSGVEQPVFAGKTIEEMDGKARAGKYEETGGMKKMSDEEMSTKGKSERRTPPSEIKNAGVKLKLTVGTVLDPPHPSTGSHSLTLESLFGKNVTKSCPIVSTPNVRIHRPNPVAEGRKDAGNTAPRLVPDPIARYYAPSAWIATESESGLILGEATWDVLRVGETGLNLTVNQEYSPYQGKEVNHPATPLTITRSLRGFDQTRGAFFIVITNHLPEEVDCWYMESVPWIIKPYLSSLKVENIRPLQETSGSSHTQSTSFNVLDIGRVVYHPPKTGDRTSPTLLEIPLTLPSRSVIQLSFEFEKMFLKYTEHPPDAQRGWDLPGGVLTPISTDPSVPSRLPRMYTPPLLADLATPDFSMPYNVILLSGSLLALLFGMTFNMLTRRFVLVPSS